MLCNKSGKYRGSTIDYKWPPELKDADGNLRSVGFELEFTGLSLSDTAQIFSDVLNGRVLEQTEAQKTIAVDKLGEFRVELDWDYLKKEAEAVTGASHLGLLRDAASLIVPIEVVCPPLPINDLAQLDPLITQLRTAGARGTDDSLLAAYGVHINPSLPNLEASTLDRYLKAFALLQGWLLRAHEVDASRKLTPYIDLFPDKYIRQLLREEAPTLSRVIDNYLKYNPTRNRALDMLPALTYLDKNRVQQSVKDDRIKARPTFHYRLPNCLIGSADWSLASAWNLWCVVEELAQRPEDLTLLGRDFLGAWRPWLGVDSEKWSEKVNTWLKDVALV